MRPDRRTLLDGLEQPHGLFFAGTTLYVAESNRIDAYDYADGRAVNHRTIAGDLPDAKSPELQGAYSHALKSVVVGSDGAVYFSIGSTGNTSAEDRTATPPRATIMRVPPGGGPAAPFATGVRNGTGLALAPDGALWTAVNNRDNVPDPQGRVRQDYVDDHPPETVAKVDAGARIGLALLQSRRSTARRVHPGHGDQRRRQQDGLRGAGTGRADSGRAFGAAGDEFHRACPALWSGSTGRGARLVEPAVTAGSRGIVLRLARRNIGPAADPGLAGFQADDGARWGRPVAAIAGPDGAVYITDDYAGAVYRLAP